MSDSDQTRGGSEQDELPEDPMGRADAFSIQQHEKLAALMRAGFRRNEAFALIRDQQESYWATCYAHMFSMHGCGHGRCGGEQE